MEQKKRGCDNWIDEFWALFGIFNEEEIQQKFSV